MASAEAYSGALRSLGKVNRKVAPRSELAAAHNRLPCDSMMDRLTDSPCRYPGADIESKCSQIP
jgi:hypothetical protein